MPAGLTLVYCHTQSTWYDEKYNTWRMYLAVNLCNIYLHVRKRTDIKITGLHVHTRIYEHVSAILIYLLHGSRTGCAKRFDLSITHDSHYCVARNICTILHSYIHTYTLAINSPDRHNIREVWGARWYLQLHRVKLNIGCLHLIKKSGIQAKQRALVQ